VRIRAIFFMTRSTIWWRDCQDSAKAIRDRDHVLEGLRQPIEGSAEHRLSGSMATEIEPPHKIVWTASLR
jgi:hypothetical protein